MPTKSAISFGLVHIPISLNTATQDIDIHFNQLHKADNSRIRYKKTCAHCGKEVTSSDIVKGFEFDQNQYVVITDDELEKIKTEKDRTIQIITFAKLDEISPVFYDKTYHAIPENGGDKAFELLRRAMMEEQKIAIAKTVLGTQETLIALIPREGGMLAQTMFFAEEVKALPSNVAAPQVQDEELNMARQLVSSMVKPFDITEYHNQYQERVKALIQQKKEGKAVVAPSEDVQTGSNIINLMDLMKKSIEDNTGKPKRGRKKAQ